MHALKQSPDPHQLPTCSRSLGGLCDLWCRPPRDFNLHRDKCNKRNNLEIRAKEDTFTNPSPKVGWGCHHVICAGDEAGRGGRAKPESWRWQAEEEKASLPLPSSSLLDCSSRHRLSQGGTQNPQAATTPSLSEVSYQEHRPVVQVSEVHSHGFGALSRSKKRKDQSVGQGWGETSQGISRKLQSGMGESMFSTQGFLVRQIWKGPNRATARKSVSILSVSQPVGQAASLEFHRSQPTRLVDGS